MNSIEFKAKLKTACESALPAFEFDCDGIFDACDESCPYFGDADSSGFHCIIIQVGQKLNRILKISGEK